ncbi:MAG: uroporphyrinogen-III decarboxylase-like protein [Candidatus Lindowbacteria bacterium]|nr:uroporphyrinogen-III decarboxylase-like protein [Candidatus Lindowbacteria bacterium]
MRLEDFPTPSPDFERLRKTIAREGEPDRVPFFEIAIDPEATEALLGEPVPSAFDTDPEQIRKKLLQDIKLMHRLSYDYVIVWSMPIVPGNFMLADDTAQFSRGARAWQSEAEGPIASRKDFESFAWPDLGEKKYTRFEFVSAHMPAGMKIVAALPGVFETIRGLMGITGLSYALHDDPSLVADVFDKVGQITVHAISNMAKIDAVGAVIVAEDMGSKNGLMMSPEHFRKLVIPWHERIGRALHERGKLFLLHACGKIEKLMDDLIQVGKIDARHSFEDQVTPIEEAKRLYGRHVAVLGGVDMDLLARGSEQEVRKRVREIASVCAPGGGFALGSGNSVANYVRPENFLAMLDEGLRL